MSDVLKPCPFCGGKAAFVPRTVNFVLQKDPSNPKFGVSVICGNCGSESPNMVDEEYAAEKWNARTAGVQASLAPRWCDFVSEERAKVIAAGVRVPAIPQPVTVEKWPELPQRLRCLSCGYVGLGEKA